MNFLLKNFKILILKLDLIDSFIINKISELDNNFSNYEKNNKFHKIYIELLNFCTIDLSSFYILISEKTVCIVMIKIVKREKLY